MHALLRFGLLAAMLCCCVTLIRHSLSANAVQTRRALLWMRGLCYLNGALLAFWLLNLLRR